jgi:hypothetical protein
VGESRDGQQALPEIGRHGQAVIDHLIATLIDLEYCEHGCADFAFWIAARPGMLLCDLCYQAARSWPRTSGGWPAGDPGMDAVVVARVASWLDAHFYLCSWCAELDLRHTRHTG